MFGEDKISLLNKEINTLDNSISIKPNPATEDFSIKLNTYISDKDIQNISNELAKFVEPMDPKVFCCCAIFYNFFFLLILC